MNTYKEKIDAWRKELDKVISGYDHVKDQVLVALLSRGHVLLRAVPGTAKTTLANTLKSTIEGGVAARFQMTPDMKPSDILGVVVYNAKTAEFETKTGPMVGAHITLFDEINRTTPKTLSATLQAMQEGIVTIGDKTFTLEELFFAIATMNPVEQEGTFPLPEATLDRFAMLLDMQYVSRKDEIAMAKNVAVHGRSAQKGVSKVVSVQDILAMREEVDKIAGNASDTVVKYIVDLCRATRPTDESFDLVHASKNLAAPKGKAVAADAKAQALDAAMLKDIIMLGASPRSIIWTLHCSAAAAFIQGDSNITPDHVKKVFRDVLRHRIMLSQVAEHEGYTSDQVIDAVLSRVPVIEPRESK
ncbi:MAG TPA: MoxR family ATPase [Planktothrix sp.]|jgi:MoxR-like ATPase